MFELIAKIPGAHPIEHATGLYIGMLLLACTVGIAVKWFTHLPYTIALTIVGLLIAVLDLGPRIEDTGFSKDLIFFVMLPPLLFHGAMHLDLERLKQHGWPILTFAVIGVVISTLLVGGIYFWIGGACSLLVAMLFGALITPTDPVSVLALFKECKVPDDLKYMVEGESLFNDGTGIVVFTIILGMVTEGRSFQTSEAGLEFLKVAGGGLVMGLILGGIAYAIMKRFEDHLLENALCLVLALGSFWLAEVVHVSGVIATVVAGLLIGNYGRHYTMEHKTRQTVDTFFESVDFLINSVLFILIGLELQVISWEQVTANYRPILAAIVGLVVARALAVYPLYWILNLRGTIRPVSWSHIMFWGGLRGSIPIALLLGLPDEGVLAEYRPVLLVSGFAAVMFSLVVQGMTVKPLLVALKIGGNDTNSG